MNDEFLENYFESLKEKIPNEDFINDLKDQMDDFNENKLEEIIKRHY